MGSPAGSTIVWSNRTACGNQSVRKTRFRRTSIPLSPRRGLQPLIEKVWRYCEANEISAKTVTLKVKYADFSQITRSKTIPSALPAIANLEEVVDLLLAPIFPPRKGIRLLGVSLSSLEKRRSEATPQLRLAL